MPVHVDSIFFTQTKEEEASDPDLVGSLARSFSEDLELPLALRDLGIDALVVDASVKAEVEVFVNDRTGNITNVFITDTTIVFALGSRVTAFGETKDFTILFEEILLLETEPCVLIIKDAGAGVRWVGSSVGKHDFAHDENAVFTGAVRVEGDWLEDAVGASSGSLLGRRSVESPLRKLLQGREVIKFLDAAFGSEIWNGRVAVKPDVIESVFSH